MITVYYMIIALIVAAGVFIIFTSDKDNARKSKKRKFSEYEVAKIKEEIKSIEDKSSKDSSESYQQSIKYANTANSKCPKCSGTNVNDRIKQHKGEISGRFSGSSFFGTGSSSGSLSGKLDTHGVNKCNDCEHEWKKTEPYYPNSKSSLDMMVKRVVFYLQNVHEYNNMKYDPLDLDEKFSSLEEKKNSKKRTIDDSFNALSIFWKGYHIETLETMIDRDGGWAIDSYYKFKDEQALCELGFEKF
jgi:hypothetical protein